MATFTETIVVMVTETTKDRIAKIKDIDQGLAPGGISEADVVRLAVEKGLSTCEGMSSKLRIQAYANMRRQIPV